MADAGRAGAPILLLDFDGVLIDSVDEFAVTAYNMITGSFARTLGEVPAGFITLMRNNRPIARKAGEFKPLGRWCLERLSAGETGRRLTEEEFKAIAAGNDVKQSGKEFFSFRQRLIEHALEDWCELNPPMQPVWEWLRTNAPGSFTILTYKNRPAVKALCKHHEMPVDDENIYASDDGTTKAENLDKIIARHGAGRRYHFVDDCIDNLLEIKHAPHGAELSLYWASWGYILPNDPQKAEAENIPDFSQTDLISLIETLRK